MLACVRPPAPGIGSGPEIATLDPGEADPGYGMASQIPEVEFRFAILPLPADHARHDRTPPVNGAVEVWTTAVRDTPLGFPVGWTAGEILGYGRCGTRRLVTS